MLTVYFVLYLLAFLCFGAAAISDRLKQPRFDLVPVGLALLTLVWLLQTLNRL